MFMLLKAPVKSRGRVFGGWVDRYGGSTGNKAAGRHKQADIPGSSEQQTRAQTGIRGKCSRLRQTFGLKIPSY